MTKLQISVMPPLIGSASIGLTNAQNILRYARLSDGYGFEAILLQDHIGIEGAETYDCFVTLGAVAAITKRINVGTPATPLPLRHPALIAKAIATVDRISNGRALLTVGAGWIKDDFEWYGMQYEGFGTRMKMMEEGVCVIKACWSSRRADFHGEFFNLLKADLQPKPVQRPRPPIWVAGVSEEALKIAVREGDGWFGWRGDQPEAVLIASEAR
jgi:alkanesulfonate monooxygenase SsuD/methylene tetrahydromethanopterin reductase-like flavin-dependent oxidoreductase (luciferase family)